MHVSSLAAAILRASLAGALIVSLAACGGGAPTDAPGASPPAPGADQELTITARNIEFEPRTLRATAGSPIVLTLSNQDASIPHNVVVLSGGAVVTKSELVTGPGTTSVRIDPPPVGVLALTCEVHPNMQAEIEVVAP